MKKEITLQQLDYLFSESYAVVVNDELYLVGYDTDGNYYTATSDGEDYISYEDVDGEIIMNTETNSVFFYIAEQPITVRFLILMPLNGN
jgi:hypothetical protein